MGMAVMMGMIAMLVMVMLVAAMIMGRAIMRRAGKRIAFRRMHMVPGIGAAFGIERRFDLDHARPEPLHHRLVAEMPGNPDQMLRIVAANFGQRLRRRDDLD